MAESSEGFEALMRCGTLCNRAVIKDSKENVSRPVLQRECIGDASESAIVKCCELNFGDVVEFRSKNKKVVEIPFNSSNKYQVGFWSAITTVDRPIVSA